MTETAFPIPNTTISRGLEFATLFIGFPLVMTFVLSPDYMWPAVTAAAVFGFVLLRLTEGFEMRSLLKGRLIESWIAFAVFFIITSAAALVLVATLRPGMLLFLPTHAPAMWLAILVLYPFFSVIPQELVYRVLFFERYGALFPNRRVAIAVNALVFGLAHLFFWNWVAVGMTVVGGLIFAHAYLGRGGFLWASVLHAVGGQIIFTSGLGAFFYHGAIPS